VLGQLGQADGLREVGDLHGLVDLRLEGLGQPGHGGLGQDPRVRDAQEEDHLRLGDELLEGQVLVHVVPLRG